ncbi:MAG: hypothetical protein JWO02_537, partial [Solirubrobacterales bacterium]|nr:hypothetical protein [Solirubrobacterales bacterium]
APVLGTPTGLPKGAISARSGVTVRVPVTGADELTVLVGDRKICTDTVAPFGCTYLPTVADVGSRTLTFIATGPGGSAVSTAAVRIAPFSGAELRLTARKTRGGAFVSGLVTSPPRVGNLVACAGAKVRLQLGATRRTVTLTKTCRIKTTRVLGKGSAVRGVYQGSAVVAPADSVSVRF